MTAILTEVPSLLNGLTLNTRSIRALFPQPWPSRENAGTEGTGVAGIRAVCYLVSIMATILVIEDEANIARAVRDRLTRDGHQVDSQASGAEALAYLRDHSPDLIILDMLMPEMDGFEVIERLHSEPTTRSIPIIVLSVLADDERLKNLSLAACISKPYRGTELLKTVHDVLAQTHGGKPHGS
ncbi:MAG: response regulator [Candidatus Ozemobacteraceae bacterium]